MSPERWSRVEEIYSEALQLTDSELPAFLSRACAGDRALRSEIGSLLSAAAASRNFLRDPILIDPDAFGAVAAPAQFDSRLLCERVERVRPRRQRIRVFFWVTLAAGLLFMAVYVYAASLAVRYGSQLRTISYLTLSLAFLSIALMIGLLRPQDKTARLGCIGSLLVALRLIAMGLTPYRGAVAGLDHVIYKMVWICDPWHLAVGYHFFYSLSLQGVEHWFWGRLRWIFYAVTGVMSPILVTFILLSLQDPQVGSAKQSWLFALYTSLFRSPFWTALETLSFAAMAGLVVYGYRHFLNLKQLRRLKWIVAGALAGLTPYVLFVAAGVITNVLGLAGNIDSRAWEIFRTIATLGLVAIPSTVAYAVLKHQLLDIRVAVRRGVQYLMARQVLRTILLVPLVWFLSPLFTNPNVPLIALVQRNSIYVNVLMMLTVFAGLRYRRSVLAWLDRKFFRESYRQENVLHGMLRDLRNTESISVAPAIVAARIEEALHPLWVSILHRERESDNVSEAFRQGEPGVLPEMVLTKFLSIDPAKLRTHHFVAGYGEGDNETPYVAIPIRGANPQLTGLILLGEKRSEDPYTSTDLDLLGDVADHMAILYDNAWLRDRVHEETRIRRQLMHRAGGLDADMLRECPKCGLCFDAAIERCSVDGSMLDSTVPVERTLAGRYRLDRRIATGGMATIYETSDLMLHRLVALKLIRSLTGLSRFENEARAAARLNHPNIVAIYDSGRVDSQTAFLVMELIAPATWRSELNRSGSFDSTTLRRRLSQLLAGLECAHRAHVVHRDLKPENILIAYPGTVNECLKVTDFGIAKLRDGPASSQTQTGVVVGTPAYMAPEQLSGGLAEERADIFTTGVMVVEALTGSLPLRRSDYGSALLEFLNTRTVLRTPVWEGLNRVLTKCLADEPERRHASVAELQADLEAIHICTQH